MKHRFLTRSALFAAAAAAMAFGGLGIPKGANAQVAVVDNPSQDISRRYDDAARWGFVTDKSSTMVAVVDTFKKDGNMVVDMLEFEVIPAEIAVSGMQNTIVYSDFQTPILYIYDLVNHEQSTMELDMVPDSFVFHEDGATLAVGGENRVTFLQPLSRTYLETLEDVQSPFTMNFDAGGYNLYITEHATGKTHIWRIQRNAWADLQMGDGGPVGEITLSPDARLALVAQEADNSVFIWDLYRNQQMTSVPMDAPAFRPYVSSDSTHIILANVEGRGQVMDAWTGETVRDLDLGGEPRVIRTGWLETIGVIETDTHLSVFEIQSQTPERTLPLSGPLNEVVVVADSKTLFATQEGSSKVLVLDIRTGDSRSPFETGLSQPNHFAMGLTNTLCN